jgi:hypothetical protein
VSWVFVWILVGLIVTMVMLVFVVALTRHALIIGRTARRFQDEVGPLAAEVADEGAKVSDRARHLRSPRRTGRS